MLSLAFKNSLSISLFFITDLGTSFYIIILPKLVRFLHNKIYLKMPTRSHFVLFYYVCFHFSPWILRFLFLQNVLLRVLVANNVYVYELYYLFNLIYFPQILSPHFIMSSVSSFTIAFLIFQSATSQSLSILRYNMITSLSITSYM